MISLTDKNGRLPPSLIGLIMVAMFILGVPVGWVAHTNWSLRAEASQLIEDMEVGTRVDREAGLKHKVLESNIEEVRRNVLFTQEDCLNYSNGDYVRSLRNRPE